MNFRIDVDVSILQRKAMEGKETIAEEKERAAEELRLYKLALQHVRRSLLYLEMLDDLSVERFGCGSSEVGEAKKATDTAADKITQLFFDYVMAVRDDDAGAADDRRDQPGIG